MNVLVLNSGSSSQKSCLYEIGDTLPAEPPACIWEGKIEWSDDQAEYSIRNSRGASKNEMVPAGSRGEAIERLLQSLWSGDTQAISGPSEIDVVGHRVVHGGLRHFEPAIVTERIKTAIEVASVFAPLHSRAELQGMEIVENCWVRCRSWRFSTLVFTELCRRRRPPIPVLTSGSSRESAATDSTVSITSIAPSGLRNCSVRKWVRSDR